MYPAKSIDVEAATEVLKTLIKGASFTFDAKAEQVSAYATPDHEMAAARLLRDKLPAVYVTAGTELSREWSEYERTATVCANTCTRECRRSIFRRARSELSSGSSKRWPVRSALTYQNAWNR